MGSGSHKSGRSSLGPPASRVLLRPALGASLAFMDAAHAESFDARDLAAWFETNLVKTGVMPMPLTVQEPGVGVVSLRDLPSESWASAYEERLRGIVRAARLRVSLALQGLIGTPTDDRFLAAAIFANRVERGKVWRPRLKGTERLSDIVLALLGADILSHRDEYDAALCVCAICGQISLSRAAECRTRCAQHLQATPRSG